MSALRDQPGERDLREAGTLPLGDRADRVDDLEVRAEILLRKARVVAPPVVGGQVVDGS